MLLCASTLLLRKLRRTDGNESTRLRPTTSHSCRKAPTPARRNTGGNRDRSEDHVRIEMTLIYTIKSKYTSTLGQQQLFDGKERVEERTRQGSQQPEKHRKQENVDHANR